MAETNQTWRLIDSGPGDGATNMAVDEALLTCFVSERSAPVLRLYQWDPPALSLGRFQDRHEVLDRRRCEDACIPVVQRITGGGVIYHGPELTYSLVCSPAHLPAAVSVKESFRELTSFLLRFYRDLGLDAVYAVDHPASDREVLGVRTPFCFAGRESYDILAEGRKIGGNAQRRQRNVIFQHGSIPLRNEAARGASFLWVQPAGVGAASAALADFGIERPVAELKSVLVEAFRAALRADPVADRLTGEELAEMERGRARQS